MRRWQIMLVKPLTYALALACCAIASAKQPAERPNPIGGGKAKIQCFSVMPLAQPFSLRAPDGTIIPLNIQQNALMPAVEVPEAKDWELGIYDVESKTFTLKASTPSLQTDQGIQEHQVLILLPDPDGEEKLTALPGAWLGIKPQWFIFSNHSKYPIGVAIDKQRFSFKPEDTFGHPIRAQGPLMAVTFHYRHGLQKTSMFYASHSPAPANNERRLIIFYDDPKKNVPSFHSLVLPAQQPIPQPPPQPKPKN